MKWDRRDLVFGRGDVLPLWVADSDFRCPPDVVEAVVKRARHGVFGYGYRSDGYVDAVCEWSRVRHSWPIEPAWVLFSPGVVTALHIVVQSLTSPGDEVVVQPPVYPPFFSAIENTGRTVVCNQLRETKGRYEIDFDDLERRFRDGAKLFILCSPHNPVGRVWRRFELEQIARIAAQYGVIVIADEIHGDLMLGKEAHVPFAAVSAEAAANSVTCTAPSKTFNLAGLQMSNVIVPNGALRAKVVKGFKCCGVEHANIFAVVAGEAAYRTGAGWLDECVAYMAENARWFSEAVRRELQGVSCDPPEGTYLGWMDCRGTGLEDAELKRLLIEKAGLGLSAGTMFGPGGSGFQRINFACPRTYIEESLRRLESVFERR